MSGRGGRTYLLLSSGRTRLPGPASTSPAVAPATTAASLAPRAAEQPITGRNLCGASWEERRSLGGYAPKLTGVGSEVGIRGAVTAADVALQSQVENMQARDRGKGMEKVKELAFEEALRCMESRRLQGQICDRRVAGINLLAEKPGRLPHGPGSRADIAPPLPLHPCTQPRLRGDPVEPWSPRNHSAPRSSEQGVHGVITQ
ncbi:unnamed protein product [Rangifer tarandus platyrhynchus]|uniref:Uncharacterized protein n=1 Tax=Rangifer tarandus platyrhynchus TaxID=3082113 RepID=A0ABN8YV66_RANTA|nr:unnamed protein product [Rangifer tarandus platyrhynchus]